VLKRTWAGEVRNVSLLVAISVNTAGYRQILGIVEGAKEDKAGWSGFLAHLKGRGLRGVELIVADACMGLVESAAEFFPEARWQRCMVHFYRHVLSHVPAGKLREVALMLKAIHAQEDLAAAQRKAAEVTARLHSMRLGKAAESAPFAAPWSRRPCPRPWRTTRFRRNTGGASGPTIRSSGSCPRSAGERAWSAPSPTATRPSTLPRRD
jgi:transposase-like protein